MYVDAPLPFHGEVVWLTPEEGGRLSGPPVPTAESRDYAATPFVTPQTVETALASLVVRVSDGGAWRSPAAAGWLVVENEPPHLVVPGDVICVTEGSRTVAHFHVAEVD
jgi:hypothetical protein